ncbi:glycoside hydrolase family 27 protein [Bifidobacterium callitrichos]|nr:glycoside hydrolase family 27 protein [Bifidobacterium callitrichos]
MTATRPAMGWNSWDSYGTSVNEDIVMNNARYMRDHLLEHGWDTLVLDAGWFDPTVREGGWKDRTGEAFGAGDRFVLDRYGRQMPDARKFPSAADGRGFTTLAARLHDMGLKLGFHLMRGIPRQAVEEKLPIEGTSYTADQVADTSSTCVWNEDNYGLNLDHPGAQAWYDSQLRLYASWGIDYLKVDDMQNPFYEREIAAFGKAVRDCGRDMFLSLSPGGNMSTRYVDFLRQYGDSWRISEDLWDSWPSLLDQFAKLARWAPYQSDAGWADADMLPMGRIGICAERGEDRQGLLGVEERKTMLTLWSMARSNLMFGGDLPTSAPSTLRMLENDALEDVTAHTVNNTEAKRERIIGTDGDEIVWAADTTGGSVRPGSVYAALFWTGSAAHEVTMQVQGITGLGHAPSEWRIVDLWDSTGFATGKAFVDADGVLRATVRPHGVVWVALEPVA